MILLFTALRRFKWTANRTFHRPEICLPKPDVCISSYLHARNQCSL